MGVSLPDYLPGWRQPHSASCCAWRSPVAAAASHPRVEPSRDQSRWPALLTRLRACLPGCGASPRERTHRPACSATCPAVCRGAHASTFPVPAFDPSVDWRAFGVPEPTEMSSRRARSTFVFMPAVSGSPQAQVRPASSGAGRKAANGSSSRRRRRSRAGSDIHVDLAMSIDIFVAPAASQVFH